MCTLLRFRSWDVVLDAGYGLHRLDRYCDGSRPVFILLSHFHLDHVAGLHTLVKFRLKAGLTICGQKGTRKALGRLVNRPFTVPLSKLPYPARVLELPKEAGELPFKATVLPLKHADPVLGFRIEADGRSVAYCTDTGYCPNALKLARDADLLITECAHLPGETNPGWPHFNPETAGRLAREAGAKKLALTHFSAARYPTQASRREALRLARKVFPAAAGGRDGASFRLP